MYEGGMMKRKTAILKKPTITTKEALAFAEHKVSGTKTTAAPAGDTRLTVNLRNDVHLKLRMKALEQKTTAGDLLEQLIEKYL
jgi:hypothetical protein